MLFNATPWDDYLAMNKYYPDCDATTYTAEQAAKILRVDTEQVTTWLEAGMLTSLKAEHVKIAYEFGLRPLKRILVFQDRSTGESHYEYR